jgi:hypothetical protein
MVVARDVERGAAEVPFAAELAEPSRRGARFDSMVRRIAPVCGST